MAQFDLARAQSYADVAYETIREAILTGQLSPGTVVTTTKLSEQLDMSRTPIREAVRRLEVEGLLVNYGGLGRVVKQLTPKDVQEICDLRGALESLACRVASERIGNAQLSLLESEFKRVRPLVDAGEFEEVNRVGERLHRLIADAADNERLNAFLAQINGQVQLVMTVSRTITERQIGAYSEHLDILDALKERNPDQAEEAMRAHIEQVRHTLLTYLGY